MTTALALLRGINVGRAKRIAMPDLRTMLTSLGCADVRTHGQSGNAIFTSGQRQAEVLELLEPLVVSEDLGDRDNAVTALGVWGTDESVPLLLNALNDYATKKWSRVHLFTALQRIKDPSCGWESCQAGEIPKRIPVSNATAALNSTTMPFTWIAASCGKE